MKLKRLFVTQLLLCFCIFGHTAFGQTTAFTYQGSLKDGANPANGNYDLEFKLFDSVSAGTQQGNTLQRLNVPVSNGIFTVSLDFGAPVLPGADRFLDIAVRTSGGGAFTQLMPRQQVNSAPYSIKSMKSTTSDVSTNAAQLGGIAANQYVVTNDPRMNDDRNPLPGSANYIQNQNAGEQSSSNFNISGTGTASIFSAGTQYNIGANHVLSTPGTNLFAGVGAGAATNGGSNAFFGTSAGFNNTTGNSNSFFGRNAGFGNTIGFNNSFFGTSAGFSNTTGNFNAFFGRSAGQNNTTGADNAFFGNSAGISNTSGDTNAFFGSSAGFSNTIGCCNAFFGKSAGQTNTGNSNAFFGATAGLSNTIGNLNAFFGKSAGQNSTTGNFNNFFGGNAGFNNTTGNGNNFFGADAGRNNSTGNGNVIFGDLAGQNNITGIQNTIIGSAADVSSGDLTNATAIGRGAIVNVSNKIRLGNTLVTVIEGQVPFTFSSDRNLKENFLPVNGRDVLRKIRGFNMTSWNYIGQDPKTFRHYGLMAQDFYAAFGRDPYGTFGTPTTINTGDMSGVLFAAIKELSTANEKMKSEISSQKTIVSNQQAQIELQGTKINSQKNELNEQKTVNLKLQSQIDELRGIVCSLKPNADGCK